MRYWSDGSKDDKEARKIRDAFGVLGYDTSCVWGNFDDGFLYHTLENDDRIYVAAKGTIEYDLIRRLAELDGEYVKVDADSIVIEPKFSVNDVIYLIDKAYRRAFIVAVDKKLQRYEVKDHNGAEYNIKFEEQDNWDVVLRPKFDEDTLICQGLFKVYIIEIEYMWQRYKVCEDGADNTFYIGFKEQDNWEESDYSLININ